MKSRSVALIILLSIFVTTSKASAELTLEGFLGYAHSFGGPLKIEQSGFEDLDIYAHYKTKSSESPLYYDLRVSMWSGQKGWELELIHEKLYLKNKPQEVQNFSISHGFNHLLINRAWLYRGYVLHLGAGLVITHPETTIRNRTLSEERGLFDDGYYISGPTIQVAIGRRFPLSKVFFVTVEAKVTGSYVHIPIEEGNADFPDLSVHGLIGVGYSFR